MEKYKNNKTSCNYMKRKTKSIIGIFLLMVFMITGTVFGVDALVLKYEYEEGGGNIVFDSSGNGFLAINTNMNYVTNPVAFGTYAGDFDGYDDYIETTLPLQNLLDFTIGTWVYPYSTARDTILDVDDGSQHKLEIQIQGGNIQMVYRDDSQNLQTLVLNGGNLPTGSYTHIALYINPVTEMYTFWLDGVIVSSGSIPNGYNAFDAPESCIIGTDATNTRDLDAVLDATFVLNFEATTDQINEMIEQNTITIEEEIPNEVETELEGLVMTDLIIDNYNPYQNENFSITDEINVNLNAPATCEFYVDSTLYKSGTDQISYTWSHDLNYGEYMGSFYCYYDYNDTRYYELIDQFPFIVTAGDPSVITFYISGSDYNVNDESLYISTPCAKHVMNVGKIAEDADKVINDGSEIYFQKIENGQSQFILSPDTYNFCLINGLIQYDENDYTTDFNINDIYGLVELGEFNLPSNVTQTYSIKTELLDIYDIANPKAFGETWGSILGGLILLLLGVIILFAGVKSNNGKIVVAGTILCLGAMGISFTGFLGVLI